MTRASLLHILNHVGTISETEIRELEQLAAAFPYCQTAHILLAKAAHDQGSMLASQRLRRAATYAADRQLLRQLLEQPAPTTVELSAPKELPAEASLPASTSGTGSSTAFFQSLVTEDVQPLEPQEEAETTAEEEVIPMVASVDSLPEYSVSSTPESTDAEFFTEENQDLDPLPATSTEVESLVEQPETQESTTPTFPSEAVEGPAATQADEQVEAVEPIVPDDPTTEATDAELTSVDVEEVHTVEIDQPIDFTSELEPASATDLEDALPAVAPPIRPPAEVGSSRFEFGLAESNKLPVPILYQLPGLEEEEVITTPNQASPLTTTALAPPFRADTDLGYALLEGGSRFGYALQLQDDELTLPLPATSFFPPDALLHEHAISVSKLRPAPAVPSSFDLINRFLKVQPRLKSPGVLPLVNEQTDLAARSTHAQPAIASESLAKILVKQGKKDRAIEIYEQLVVRQPEKSAYFADQIQQLKTLE